MRLVRFSAALAVLAGVLASSAGAQENWIWLGPNGGADPASGDYNTGANWIDETTQTIPGPPGPFDSALHFAITSGSPYTVSSNTDNELATVLVTTEAGGTADNTTYDWNGNTLTGNGGIASDQIGFGVVTSGGNGSLTLLDGEYLTFTSINVAADLAADPAGSATMTIGAGATLLTDALALQTGADTIGGFTNPDQAGTLNIIGGGKMDSNQPQLGTDAGTSGIVNVTGAGSELLAYKPGADASTARAIAVGLEGTGEMNVTNGALVKTQFLGVAGGFTGLTGIGGGSITVDNATLIHEGAFNTDGSGTVVDIGDGGGTGDMTLTNNATFTTDFLVIAGGTGNEANLRVEGGSDWTSSQWRIGEDLGGTGRLTVDGAGSSVVSDFRSFVGLSGAGELNVTNGGLVRLVHDPASGGTGVFVVAGAGATSTGTTLISGAGSTVSSEGSTAGGNSIMIGRQGAGTVTVSSGGLLTTDATGNMSLGFSAGSAGTLTVTGAGSIGRGHLGIFVGGTATAVGGAGTLNITNGGSIQTTNLVVHSGRTVNVNTGGFGTIGTIGTVVNTANTLTVRTGGTLKGNGTINGNVAVVTGGTVAPGLSPGLLTINGNLNHGNCVVGAGGTYAMEINAAGTAGTNYDSMSVSGDVLLGGTLNLIVSGSYVPNGANQFNVITGTNNIVGAFESITNRVITPGVGGRVWGDYKENNAGPGADRYYVSPRRQADFNGTGGVSGADYTIWADNFGKTWATFGEGDANGDRQVTGADYTIWADNFGQTSIGADLVPVSAYGYGVELQYEAPSVQLPDEDMSHELVGIRMQQLEGYGYGGSVNPVPEPSTVLLGGLALAGLAGYALRRRGA